MKQSEIRIAISGKSGCGNTTVSKLVADRLGLRFINFTFRSLASEKGLTLEEVLAHAQKDFSWDREVDERQVAIARQDGGCVLGSRLAVWMLPEAQLKVYLRASPAVRAARINQRENGDLEAIMAFTMERDRQDSARYKILYGINNDDFSVADLVIDTDTIGPEAIADLIINTVAEKGRA